MGSVFVLCVNQTTRLDCMVGLDLVVLNVVAFFEPLDTVQLAASHTIASCCVHNTVLPSTCGDNLNQDEHLRHDSKRHTSLSDVRQSCTLSRSQGVAWWWKSNQQCFKLLQCPPCIFT